MTETDKPSYAELSDLGKCVINERIKFGLGDMKLNTELNTVTFNNSRDIVLNTRGIDSVALMDLVNRGNESTVKKCGNLVPPQTPLGTPEFYRALRLNRI